MIMKKERKNPLRKSFGYAFEGILTGILQERNMKIHCVAIILVTAAGTLFQISPWNGASASCFLLWWPAWNW